MEQGASWFLVCQSVWLLRQCFGVMPKVRLKAAENLLGLLYPICKAISVMDCVGTDNNCRASSILRRVSQA